jgi:hypothetical protein
MRVGLFLAVWLLLQLITPIRGLWGLFVAIIVSGVLSAFVLNRQRTAMGEVIGRFFGGINARIDAASRAEDDPVEGEFDALQEQAQGQSEAQGAGVDDHEPTGSRQRGDESGSLGPGQHDAQRSQSPRERGETE